MQSANNWDNKKNVSVPAKHCRRKCEKYTPQHVCLHWACEQHTSSSFALNYFIYFFQKKASMFNLYSYARNDFQFSSVACCQCFLSKLNLSFVGIFLFTLSVHWLIWLEYAWATLTAMKSLRKLICAHATDGLTPLIQCGSMRWMFKCFYDAINNGALWK